MYQLRPDPKVLEYLARRLVGGVIDLLVMGGVQFGIVRALTALVPPTHSGSHFSTAGVVWFGILGPLAWLVYTVLPLARTGSTLGKQIAGIKVVDHKGRRPTLSQAFWRESAGKWLSAMIVYLGYVWPLWDRDRQALHDLVAETYVVLNPGHSAQASLYLGKWEQIRSRFRFRKTH